MADFDRIDQAARKSRRADKAATVELIYGTTSIASSVLQQYGLTSLNPTKWEDVESEDTAQLALDTDGLGGGTRDMDDPLGLRDKLTM